LLSFGKDVRSPCQSAVEMDSQVFDGFVLGDRYTV
jgi:hypothetical protein